MEKALDSTNHSSPGPDSIPYEMLHALPQSAKETLLELYNNIWIEGIYPEQWRNITIVPIPKPGKDPKNTENYRPISLSSCISKVFEKMLCETCNHLVGIFFDLEKAYDMTWKYGILKQLQEWGLKGNLPKFIESFLFQRSFKVRVGNTLSDEHVLDNGIPQGSTLSVTLFAIAINSLFKDLNPAVGRIMYVDDITIFFSSDNMDLIQRTLQQAINSLVKEADNKGFKFSVSKKHLQPDSSQSPPLVHEKSAA
ncbi:hypothetical protein JTB14_014723 [Gonioctena quinquepunctata]|nr:hypothetical protein JTB14_014723 [Gonioctena quinquepunctata]